MKSVHIAMAMGKKRVLVAVVLGKKAAGNVVVLEVKRVAHAMALAMMLGATSVIGAGDAGKKTAQVALEVAARIVRRAMA